MAVYLAVVKQEGQAGAAAAPITDYETERAAAGLTEEALRQSAGEQWDRYAYRCLTEEERTLYVELLMILERMEDDIMLSVLEEDTIDKVFQCVLYDHPELFYVEGYQITKYTVEEETRRITFRGTYTFTREEAESRKRQIEQYVSAFLDNLPPDLGEYEKVKYIYEYLILHTEYDLQAQENQTICSVFLYGASVCQGYAKAMQYLCQRAGVESVIVLGSVDNGEGHAWNLVKIDGAYYYVDATWGDAFYVFESQRSAQETEEARLPSINYDYLCVTTEQLYRTHQIDMAVAMPRCVEKEANYYVKEGAYFESADMDRAKKLFARAYEDGQEMTTLKCADEAVYAEMRRLLIEEQQVFQYIEMGENAIAYTENEAQLTLSFWL